MGKERIKDIGEIGLIKRFTKMLRYDASVVKGIGDDAAVVRWTKDKHLLLTCDMLIEGVHFTKRGATPFEIGWKALARNVSDIAAMGGVPRWALASVAIDPELPVSFSDGIMRGISTCAKRFGVNVVGGDTSRSKKIVIDISLIGEAETRHVTYRSGARVGDLVFVTGTIGGSQKGKHLKFIPRLAEARMLASTFHPTSMIDISDGLLLDLSRICAASKVGARIYENAVPLSKDADSFDSAVSDGEDFELLFTMSIKDAKRFFKLQLSKCTTPVRIIGEVVSAKDGINVIDDEGRAVRFTRKGFLHF